MSTQHVPVMVAEVLAALQPRSGVRLIDGTLGGGGHTRALLAASEPNGRVLALDADPAALARATDQLQPCRERLTLVQANFRTIERVATARGFAPCDGVLLDLGLSSDQLALAERGFSFQQDGPLDMRFDPTAGPTAADLLNGLSESELADIFYHYGEERRSRRLARVIVERRRTQRFSRTLELVAAIEAALGGRRGRLHPATRVFQALRIAVNDELDALREALLGAARLLKLGGRLAVLSFHSLEDRIVKQFIQGQALAAAQPHLRALTRRPVQASEAERAVNVRSRSAKLRVAERVEPALAA